MAVLVRWLRWSRGLRPLVLALAGVVVLLNLLSVAFGVAPRDTLVGAFAGTWGTAYGAGQVLFKATPLVFTALAFQVALRAGLFNIGTEGQLALGSLCAGWVGASLPTGCPAIVALPACLLAAMTGAAAVAFVPAVMRARLGVHEIISTIMMNRIVDGVVPFVLVTALGAAALRTRDLVPGASVMKLDRLFPALRGSAASLAFPFAVAVAFGLAALLEKTRAGREMRWVGLNATACEAEGVPVARRRVQAMLLSGALAGSAATATVLGYKGYFELGLGAGSGFAGIAVALLGGEKPLGVVLAAILIGTLEQAGLALNAHVPKESMDVLTAATILLVAASKKLAERAREARA